MHQYYLIAKPEHYPRPLRLSLETPLLNYQPDLAAYDSLAVNAAESEEIAAVETKEGAAV